MVDIHWVVKPRVLTITLRGVLTPDDIQTALAALAGHDVSASVPPYVVIDLQRGESGLTLHDLRGLVLQNLPVRVRHVYLFGARSTDLCFAATSWLRMLKIPHTLVSTYDDAMSAIERESGLIVRSLPFHTLNRVG